MASLDEEIIDENEDLNDLVFFINEGYLENDSDFNMEMDAVISEISSISEVDIGFKCDQCKKVYKSSRGLTRHTNAKHAAMTESRGPTFNWMSEEDVDSYKKLSMSKLFSIFKASSDVVAADMCLPLETRKKFQDLSLSRPQATELWKILRPVVDQFHGDTEKYYANFYGLLAENTLPSVFHLSDKSTDLPISTDIITSISDKEAQCLHYISGYVIHKLHNKFRFHKHFLNDFNYQCIEILKSCRTDSDDNQILV